MNIAHEVPTACPLCDHTLNDVNGVGGRYYLACDRCGLFQITGSALQTIRQPKLAPDRYLLSAHTRRLSDGGTPGELTTYNIDNVIQVGKRPRSLLGTRDEILRFIERNLRSFSEYVPVRRNDYPVFALRDGDEMVACIRHLGAAGLIDFKSVNNEYRAAPTFAGWERLADLSRTKGSGNQAFVAMWFDPQMDKAYEEGIEPALLDTGWRPLKINRKQHNNRIDDEIVAEIRRSGLLVADCTGFRSGVFFEAGLAIGLDLKVIWMARKGQRIGSHFDTRQYNHVVWKDPADLKKQLTERILATAPAPLVVK